MRPLLVLSIALAGSSASADDHERIVVEVGQTVEREVGWAMGSVCDDAELVASGMRNKDRDTNVFWVTGKRPGTTLCRAGTYQIEDRPTFLFEVTVVAKPRAPQAAR